jgi:DNA-binding LacI/PurR family transcriptional regulator/DNA-binding transcriptional regulator YhcF (GntR family)
MAMTHRTEKASALTSAAAFITNYLSSETAKPGHQLPPVRKLAHMSGISKTTMARAVSSLIQKKAIDPASYNHKTASISSESIMPINRHRIRDQVERDIISGHFGLAGKLPLLKELQSRYGVCFRTMRRILGELEKDGIVKSSGKGYMLPGTAAKTLREYIVFITCKGHYSQGSALNHQHNRIVNLFENECMRFGIQLEIVEMDFYDSAESRRAALALKNSEHLLGIVLDVWWYDPPDYQRSYLDVLARVAGFKKPLAILDEISNFNLPTEYEGNSRLQVYRIQGKKAGEQMARYLLGLGHQSVVYISSLHQAAWSHDRYDGVLAQFSRAGFGAGVHICGDEYHLPLEFLLAASGLTDTEVGRIIAAGRTISQAKDLTKNWQEFKKQAPDKITGDMQIDAYFRVSFKAVANIMQSDIDPAILGEIGDAALSAIGAQAFGYSLRPLLQQAIQYHNATAWICATDWTALSAKRFLGERHIQVPEQISIVGFDNIPVEALEHRLTTFDFNAMGFIRRMLNFIVRPPKPRGPYRHAIIEVEGTIMQRDTAGKAPVMPHGDSVKA